MSMQPCLSRRSKPRPTHPQLDTPRGGRLGRYRSCLASNSSSSRCSGQPSGGDVLKLFEGTNLELRQRRVEPMISGVQRRVRLRRVEHGATRHAGARLCVCRCRRPSRVVWSTRLGAYPAHISAARNGATHIPCVWLCLLNQFTESRNMIHSPVEPDLRHVTVLRQQLQRT